MNDELDMIPIERGLLSLAVTALKQASLIGHATAQAINDPKAKAAMMASVKGQIDLTRLLEDALRSTGSAGAR